MNEVLFWTYIHHKNKQQKSQSENSSSRGQPADRLVHQAGWAFSGKLKHVVQEEASGRIFLGMQ